jgi:hypothetical protein
MLWTSVDVTQIRVFVSERRLGSTLSVLLTEIGQRSVEMAAHSLDKSIQWYV